MNHLNSRAKDLVEKGISPRMASDQVIIDTECSRPGVEGDLYTAGE